MDIIINNKVTPSSVRTLSTNEIFVFGTDSHGEHKSEAAKYANLYSGAKQGICEGLVGQSYAIPIHKHRIRLMQDAIIRFIDFARHHPDKEFLVLPIGCGKAGLDVLTVSYMFKDAINVKNISLPDCFISTLRNFDDTSIQFDKSIGKLLHRESFGNNLIWSLYDDGTLEMSGYGAMPNYINHWNSYFGEGQAPWIGCDRYGIMPYKLRIKHGITYVGDNAFDSFGCLKEVYLAHSVTKLGKMAFFDCFHIEKINIPIHMSINYFNIAELPLFYNKEYIRIGNVLLKKGCVKTNLHNV